MFSALKILILMNVLTCNILNCLLEEFPKVSILEHTLHTSSLFFFVSKVCEGLEMSYANICIDDDLKHIQQLAIVTRDCYESCVELVLNSEERNFCYEKLKLVISNINQISSKRFYDMQKFSIYRILDYTIHILPYPIRVYENIRIKRIFYLCLKNICELANTSNNICLDEITEKFYREYLNYHEYFSMLYKLLKLQDELFDNLFMEQNHKRLLRYLRFFLNSSISYLKKSTNENAIAKGNYTYNITSNFNSDPVDHEKIKNEDDIKTKFLKKILKCFR
ncbi:hypothetical protein H311_00018 [Anncaliia algerae PRA109]|nr:hypothetical protein H311_00018 [Anncaliia algerae PRA109]